MTHTVMIKKYRYLIGIFILFFISIIYLWMYFKKENIYIFLDENISDCKKSEFYKKEMYYICNKGNKFLLKKKTKESVKLIDDLEDIKLSSKDFFLNSLKENNNDNNYYLIIINNNRYEIIPIRVFQVFSESSYKK